MIYLATVTALMNLHKYYLSVLEIIFLEYILRNGVLGLLQKHLEMKERELKTLRVRKKRTGRELGRCLVVVKSKGTGD